MSCLLSIAPDKDCKPISYVPPSPPNAMNFVCLSSGNFPCFFIDLYAASAPDNVAPAHSNAVCINESVQAVYGYINVDTSIHPVATATTA